ncbi:MAG: geranylgeranyl reductase family protein [Candidatus Asgardarchaeia archaeon]
MQEYDVAIIGGGPAGLTAARFIAEKGYSVVVFEEDYEIGVPLRCGEFLPSKEEITQKLLTRAPEFLLEYPSKSIMNDTKYMRLYAPNGKAWTFNFSGHVISRHIFDSYLAVHAGNAGSEIKVGARVVQLDGHIVITKNDKISAKVIVGADGPLSLVARSLNFPHYQNNVREMIYAIEFQMSDINVESDVIEMYFGEDYTPGGYAWIIPKDDDFANVGLGIRMPFVKDKTTLNEFLKRFINKHPVASQKLKKGKVIAKVSGVVPVGGPLQRTYNDFALLVGDAGGFVMASNGGGVPTALISGYSAAEAIDMYLSEQSKTLAVFEELWKKYMGNELGDALYLRKLMDVAMKSDTLMNKVMSLLGENAMADIVRCKVPSKIKSILKLFMR